MNTPTLEQSRAYCHELMRTAARNFYFGMRLLPLPQRQAMFALYAWMRLIDDIADDPAPHLPPPQQQLESWRQATHAAIAGRFEDHPVWPAFHEAVTAFRIPPNLFDDAIAGQLDDLAHTPPATFPDLYTYCYRVASTVGVAAVHIWGFTDPAALKLAELRGIAFQLTNVLRDLREDAERNRCYLPADERERFGCRDWSPLDPPTPAALDLLRFQIDRARDYYRRSADLERLVSPPSRPTLRIMTSIYRGILEKIARNPARALQRRASLSTFAKLAIVARYAYLPGGRA